MPYDEIPSDEQVVGALNRLNGLATAKALCDELVDQGHPRRDSQLAIQRAAERGHIEFGADWKLHVAAQVVAA
jgi:hypothetical protein